MASSHKASVINHNNTAGKQHCCGNPLIWVFPISTFLLEPLAKKICSVSFVSQYIYVLYKDYITYIRLIQCEYFPGVKCISTHQFFFAADLSKAVILMLFIFVWLWLLATGYPHDCVRLDTLFSYLCDQLCTSSTVITSLGKERAGYLAFSFTSQLMRLWYLSHRRPAKAQASLRGSAQSHQSLRCSHT